MKKYLIVAFFISLLIVFGGCSKEQSESQVKQPSSNSVNGEAKADAVKFPEFESIDLDGNEINQELFADNKITVVNLWATS